MATKWLHSDIKINFNKFLLEWWDKNKLAFPWRSFSNKFHNLVTEILLRKTNAEKVQNFIDITVRRLGSPEDILSASHEELESILKPFGMQRRKTKELKMLAQYLVDKFKGRVPESYEELMSLPGVGQYIANSVLCFSFGHRRPLIDVNIIRVFNRVFGFNSSRARARDDPSIWKFAEELLPESRYKEYNYAVIDFAKQVCKLRKPLCLSCPLNSICHFYLSQISSKQKQFGS